MEGTHNDARFCRNQDRGQTLTEEAKHPADKQLQGRWIRRVKGTEQAEVTEAQTSARGIHFCRAIFGDGVGFFMGRSLNQGAVLGPQNIIVQHPYKNGTLKETLI